MFKLKPLALSLAVLMSPAAFSQTYNNMYLSYVSPNAVNATVKYANSQGIHQFFFWTYAGDVDYNSSASLIQAVNNADSQSTVEGYWPDWGIYSAGNAIPTPPYPLSGNTDLNTKLQHSTTLVYAFLEAQVDTFSNDYRGIYKFKNPFVNVPGAYGSLYFFDPYSDLKTTDAFCTQPPSGVPTARDPQIAAANLLCDYVPLVINKATESNYSYYDFANYGNFEALSDLTISGKDGHLIHKMISVGGYGHDDSFESIFNPPSWTGVTQQQAMNNFVNSAKAIMDAYHIDGIDLDYENPAMTPQQSDDYLTLITMLSQALANDNGKYITLAILANPAYIKGTEAGGSIGFDPHYQGVSVLNKIAQLPNIKAIDLMTYDFHGTWDYNNPTSGTGTTGFLSNLYMPTDAPSDQFFSIDTSIAALLDLSIASSKIGVGFPAYARSFSNIDPGRDGTGLFSPLTSNTLVPAGDLDPAGCSMNISYPSCAGMFSYQFIVNHMLNHGFSAHDATDSPTGAVNGTTAFAGHWDTP